MLNIEVHGMNVWEGDEDSALVVKDAIYNLFEKEPFFEDMVVTLVPSDVYNCRSESQPFLRVYNSDEKEIPQIFEKLKTLGMDIEFKKLDGFVPKLPNIAPVWER